VETVRAFATAGASVILCSRSVAAGEAVAKDITDGGISGTITVKQLDLADLKSVKTLGDAITTDLPRLDILVLNAGVMACPLSRTAQGFEMQVRSLSRAISISTIDFNTFLFLPFDRF
jgi:NAD(P)-dependent dehydrogenase (short-subunit alcohol dehydrogenase family)